MRSTSSERAGGALGARWPGGLRGARRVGDWFLQRYFTLDLRVLALFRVVFGCFLVREVARQWREAALFLSNEGVLSNHFALFRPYAEANVSLFHALSSPREVQFGLLFVALVSLLYAVGWHTKSMQLLVFVLFSSLNVRNLLTENGGKVTLVVLAAWTLFLPLGARWSVDAWRKDPRSLNAPGVVTSVACLGVVLQIACIYFFNTVQKTDPAWSSGEAIHYVLWQDRIATPLAAWLRVHEPSWFSWFATRGTLIVEGSLCLLVLSPFAVRVLRTLHVVFACCLHGTILLLMELGPFSYAMIALNLLVLPPFWLDFVQRKWVARTFWAKPSELPIGTEEKSKPVGSTGLDMGLLALREVAAATLLVAIAMQVSVDNFWVPASLRHAPSGLVRALIEYPRLLQGWMMFARIPRDDGRLVIDAVLASGRHVDPLEGGEPNLNPKARAPWLMSSEMCDYQLRVAGGRGQAYQSELARFVRRYHFAEDYVRSYRVLWMWADSPAPGSSAPGPVHERVLFTNETDGLGSLRYDSGR